MRTDIKTLNDQTRKISEENEAIKGSLAELLLAVKENSEQINVAKQSLSPFSIPIDGILLNDFQISRH